MPRFSLLVVALFFLSGGIAHFAMADFFVRIMPSYLPYHLELVYLSGILEMLGAIGIMIPAARLYAAYGLIALSIAVFPANINMAVNAEHFDYIPVWALYLRLPLQLLIIWFIWRSVAHERVGGSAISTVSSVDGQSPAVNQLEWICRELMASLSGLLQWKWDDRYKVVLAEFGIESEEQVLAALERYFKHLWDSNSILSASDQVRKVVDDMGGLKPGQLLFTSEPIDGTFLFCTLWPWGNRKTISIRVSPDFQASSDEEKDKNIVRLQTWFGIDAKPVGWVKMNVVDPKLTA